VQVHLDNKERVHSEVVLKFNEPMQLRARVFLGEIDPDDVKVQVYLSGELQTEIESSNFELIEMTRKKKQAEDGAYIYEASITPSNSGNYRYTVRVMPFSKRETNMAELGLVTWLS
ncbi:MAG TPA: hypothetical protein PKV71_21515, partial [Calditrichia bacterium]|nr:hypothetical protein [Calditrichia bacterium]